MTPIQAYQHTSNRAHCLFRLHDGLVNIRKRSIRKDWKQNFCRLMRWKLSSAINRIDSRQAVIILRENSELKPRDFSTDALDDLLRAAIVLAVSGLDRYVHERVVKGIIKALRDPDLNRTQEDFSIPAYLTLEITNALQLASTKRRQLRPANEVRKKIQELIHLRPFQSWREIEFAFELIGVTDLAGQLQTAYGVGDIRPTKKTLNGIIKKRNEIVHEADLIRHQRGGKVRCLPITPGFVQGALDFTDVFALRLETVTS